MGFELGLGRLGVGLELGRVRVGTRIVKSCGWNEGWRAFGFRLGEGWCSG